MSDKTSAWGGKHPDDIAAERTAPKVPARDPDDREILDTRWGIQVWDDGGYWDDYAQYTWDERENAARVAAGLYGGTATTRLVKVTKEVDHS